MAVTNDEILSEIKGVNSKIDGVERQVDGIKKSLFGQDGTGGMVRTMSDLCHTIGGNPVIPDSRGIAGDFSDLKIHVKSINGDVKGQKTSIKWLTWATRVIVGAVATGVIGLVIFLLRG